MNKHLQTILDFIQQNEKLTAEEKDLLIKEAKATDSELTISEFKLERTEKVKRTTAILLEETIEELEQKRKAVEEQNKELEIETALERVRSIALSMKEPADMLKVCRIISEQLQSLNVKDIRNVQTAILNESKGIYLNYEYFTLYDKTSISEIEYNLHPKVLALVNEIKEASDTYFTNSFEGKELEEWRQYREQTDQVPDPHSYEVTSVHYYFYSIGPGGLGVSTYNIKLNEEELIILKRFRNVFELAYRRFLDIEKAEAQAREVRIELALERVRARTMAMQNSEELSDTAYVLFQQFKELGENPHQITIGIIKEAEGFVEFNITGANGSGEKINHSFKFDINEPALIQKLVKEWKENKKSSVIELAGKDLTDWVAHRNLVSGMIDNTDYSNARRYVAAGFFTKGLISISTVDFITTDTCLLLERFAKVFEQTYTRFLDLQKAEAQAREAQIEYALEKVRSRTMAMQKSEELHETSQILFQQMKELREPVEQLTIGIVKETENVVEVFATVLGSQLQQSFRHSIDEPTVMNKIYRGWKAQQKSLLVELNSDEIQVYNRYRNELVKSEMFSTTVSKDERRILYAAYFSKGMLALGSNTPLSEESHRLLERFAGVFDGTYTRFLDLQKAEAQAREAQIELALERVRARTMAMQKSSELAEAAQLLYEEFKTLHINTFLCGYCFIKVEQDKQTVWITLPDGTLIPDFTDFPLEGDYVLNKRYEDWKQKKPLHVLELQGEVNKEHHRFLASKIADQTVNEIFSQIPDRIIFYCANFSTGYLFIIATEFLTREEEEVIHRFAKVFEQTYIRFLDLQKAEAQAREAKIEAALERVRSRTMAMHKSDELQEVSKIIIQQIVFLNFPLFGFGIHICHENEPVSTAWIGDPTKGQVPTVLYEHTHDSLSKLMYKGWKEGESLLVKKVQGEELKEHFEYMVSITPISSIFETATPPEFIIYHFAYFSHGFFVIAMLSPYEEAQTILKRFAKVFEQTYTRFLDLQKAEAQAREAKIEAALEKVRSKAMAMQKSDDLANAVAIVFEELDKLNLGMLRCGIGILNKEKRCAQVWTTTISDNNTVVQVSGDESMDIHPLLHGAFEAWLDQQVDNSYVLRGEDLNNYYKAVAGENLKLPKSQSLIAGAEGIEQHYFVALFSAGGLFAFRKTEFPEEAKIIMRRFSDVFDFTYTRFNDLKQAEAQAREAQIETGLERVRSRTLAMQKSDELSETAAEVFKQLINLGIEPNRLYIGIVKDESGDMEMWATDEDGTKVGQKFMFNKNENASVKKLYDGWAAKEKSVIVDMQGKELEDYFHYLNDVMHIPFKAGLTQKRRVQSVAYFSKGFIGMASPDGQGNETIQLLERFAAVFNLTFTRFNDLKIAEAHAEQAEQDLIAIKEAKQKAEDALIELQVTQKQLIQSEKMASLGELTAGIAHEIQNPLNFVNNFSEVSKELLDEMKTALDNGDSVDAKEIANDVIQNLEKINHHGKRADAIVKGMLQHSRSSSGIKEPTDINALADEYLRLSYHGLRAKDKSFNATFKTDFDESLEKINIIPQDIGRVILNLLTNAFYVVDEKKKASTEVTPFEKVSPLYEPTVSISTKKVGDKVLISVSDNGNGIPQNVLDKIFQPFFTTKPTGQGTGLGLSLSYDIITKGHGGELKVETKEGEGSKFVIILPG